MSQLRRWLALALLAPGLSVLLVAAANPRPMVSVRLLTWSSPRIPVGTWLVVGVGTGLALGAGTSSLALWAGVRRRAAWSEPVRRQERRVVDPGSAGPPRPSSRSGRRDSDPAPTVTVPFRVLQRPASRQPATMDDDDWGHSSADTW